MSNNDNLKKMYHDGSLVGLVGISQGGMETPSALTSWSVDEWGRMTDVVVKDGQTEIPASWQRYNNSLISVTLPNSITTIGQHAYDNAGNNMHINIPSGVTFVDTHAFDGASIDSDLTIPYGSMSAATSGYNSTWVYGFNNATFNNNTVTIESGATIIPQQMFYQTKNVTVIVPDTVTYLVKECFSPPTYNGTITVKFLGTTPPSAQSYTYNSTTCPFYAYNSSYLNNLTILVPSGSKNAYTNMFGSNIGARVQTY